MSRGHRQQGIVLVLVLFFALLLASSVASFLRRATVDAMIVRNRDRAAQAEALARGGVRLATALLLEDRLLELDPEGGEGLAVDTLEDVWAKIGEHEIEVADGILRLHIEDSGARLNLNALFQDGEPIGDEVELLLESLLEKVVEEMPGRPEDKLYDALELARALIDYVDKDEVRRPSGDPEDEYYQSQKPAYRPANRPLLSVDELGLVEGFDTRLVRALEPYVTVYPLVGGSGVNLNTAPPWVLATIYYNDGVDHRLADEDKVKQILKERQKGRIICPGQQRDGDTCTPLSELFVNKPFPEPPAGSSETFTVVSEARVGDIRRAVEAVIDRSDPREPLVLAWRVR